MKKRIMLVFIILWIIIIFSLSNQNYFDTNRLSINVVTNVLYGITSFLKINISKSIITTSVINYLYYFRKCAHMFEYFVLEILFLILLSYNKKINNKKFIFSFILCFLFATFDEIHQSFVFGRTSSMLDVIIDFIGAIIGATLFYIISSKLLYSSLQKDNT